MLRRSSSSSNIPVPKTNLFNNKDSKTKIPKRSHSATRLSQRDSVSSTTQHRIQRKSSLDRKSSTVTTVGLLRATPLHKVGSSSRSGSLQRTTPSSSAIKRGTCRGTTPSSCRKEHVTIQKLSNDKKWVAEQYVKVQNFIMSSNLFDLGVVNDHNIKPPSINIFIYVTGIMFMEIFPRIKISKENYKELIPAHLKVLRYPGTLTNSLLKTVNTMHSWPQVIGMWSWLINKVNLGREWDDLFLDRLKPEDRLRFLIEENAVDFYVRRYNIFNQGGENTEEIEKVNNDYVDSLAELLDVDFDKLGQLQQDVADKTEYRKNQEQEINMLKAENMEMELEMEQMKKEIADFQETDPVIESELDDELQLLQSRLKERRKTIDSTKENISRFQEAIKAQPCSYQKKLALLKHIEELKKEIQVKKEKIELAREIKDEFDHKLSTELNKIQSLVIQWNRSLMEAAIKKPVLKNLLLREKGFHDPEFLKELEEWSENNVSIKKEVMETLAKVGEELRMTELKRCEVEKEYQKLDENLYQITEECKIIGRQIREIAGEIDKVTKDSEEKKTSHAKQMKELSQKDLLEAQAKTMAEKKCEQEHLEEEVKKFGIKMLSFFVEMHNQIVTNVKEMERIKVEMATRIAAKQAGLVEKQREIIEILKSFDA